MYTSALAIEFDERFVERARVFETMLKVMSEAKPQAARAYRLKRLAFGTAHDGQVLQPPLVEQFASSDFSLERRVTVPFEKNIFFSSAPLETDDHARYLERS